MDLNTSKFEVCCIRHRVGASAVYLRHSHESIVVCPLCEREWVERNEAQRREERTKDLRIRSGIPNHFLQAAIADCEPLPSKVADWASAALRGRSPGPLLLVGPTGTGKTYLSAALLGGWHAQLAPALYTAPVYYADAIRRTWSASPSEPKNHDVVERYAGAPILVVDDIEDGDAPVHAMVAELISRRYDRDTLRSSILISNLDVGSWNKVLPARVVDRIRQGSVIQVIDGPARRTPHLPRS